MLHQRGRPMAVFSKKLNSFSGEAAQHGRPLQTPLVSLINLSIIACQMCCFVPWQGNRSNTRLVQFLTFQWPFFFFSFLHYNTSLFLLILSYNVKFAMLFSFRLTRLHWRMYRTQPGIIVHTITKGLSHSTTRLAEQRDNATLHLDELFGLVML